MENVTPSSQGPDSLERTIKNEDSLINAETGAVGAASGIAIGALAGAIAGPPGAIAGAVIGAIVGGLSGSAMGEQRREERLEERQRARENVAIDQGVELRDSDPTLAPVTVDTRSLPARSDTLPDSRIPVSVLPLVVPARARRV